MEENTLKDRLLICKDCHRRFIFAVKEQMDWGAKGWADPVRCRYCRRMKSIRTVALKDNVRIGDEVRFSEECAKCHRSFLTKKRKQTGINLYCDDCWAEIKMEKPHEENRQENSGMDEGKAGANQGVSGTGDNTVRDQQQPVRP